MYLLKFNINDKANILWVHLKKSYMSMMPLYKVKKLQQKFTLKEKALYEELHRLSCEIFGVTHNPMKLRTGEKYLKRPLLGNTYNAYWPMTTKELFHPLTAQESDIVLINKETDNERNQSIANNDSH